MTKIKKKNIKTPNILIINHLFDVTDWKYLKDKGVVMLIVVRGINSL